MPTHPPMAIPAPKRSTPYRGSSTVQGYGTAHRKWRAHILERDPICKLQVLCDGAPSRVADHIQPRNKGGAQYDYDNGQGVCEKCHNHKRATSDKEILDGNRC